MKKIKLKKLNKKQYYIIGGVALLVIIVIVSLLIIFGNKPKNESQKLSNELKQLGVSFYEDFYYNQIGKTDEEKKAFLEKYTDIGIKVSLDNLARSKKDESEEILKKFVNSKTNTECDKTNSMVTIYPREPYGKKDYRIDANLVCGFEVEETK